MSKGRATSDVLPVDVLRETFLAEGILADIDEVVRLLAKQVCVA